MEKRIILHQKTDKEDIIKLFNVAQGSDWLIYTATLNVTG